MSRRVASIDFGTNTARVLIVDRADDGSFTQVVLEREIVRMGGGFTLEHGLSDAAISRGIACLNRFSACLQAHAVDQVRAVATSAVRDAVNGPAFLQRVADETGITLSVIDGVLEGNLTLAGVLAGLDQQHEEILLFDIGGGSTEFTLARSGVVDYVHSTPLGVVRLTEGKVTVEAMIAKIRKELELVRIDMERAGLRIGKHAVMVATAGTATTLAAISQGLTQYDQRKVNNSLLTRMQVADMYQRLLPLTLAERLQVPGLEPGREDLIIAGILLTLEAMDLFGMKSLKVSDYGLLEGLIVSLPI